MLQENNTVVPANIKQEKIDEDNDEPLENDEISPLAVKNEPEFTVKTEQEFFENWNNSIFVIQRFNLESLKF